MARSQAGSPTPLVPKSMTAASRPPSTSRLPVAMSPWNQSGAPPHCGFQGGVPDLGGAAGVDAAVEIGQAGAGLGVVVAGDVPR